jgi:hypothetical protein
MDKIRAQLTFAAFVISLLATVADAQGQAGAVKVECHSPAAEVTTIIEINYSTRQVTQWARFSSGHVDGPLGPYPAAITPDTITWTSGQSPGQSIGPSHHSLDRLKSTLDIRTDNGAGVDKANRLNTPCDVK